MPFAHVLPAQERGLSTRQLGAALGIDYSPSAQVDIDWTQIDRISAHLQAQPELRQFEPATWDDDTFWNVDDPPCRRSQFFAVGNAINFRFWSLQGSHVRPATGTLDGKSYRGAMYMWRALRRELERGTDRILDAEFLASMTESDFDSIFRDDNGLKPLAVAGAERLANLRDLGQNLLTGWDGQFFNVLKSTDGSIVRFARQSRCFRAFDDPIYKLTMVNAILHSGSGVYEFKDEPLPGVDYHLLRHSLRQGLLLPHSALERKLKASELLSSTEAYDLRRLALIAYIAVAERTGLSGAVLDNRYWLNRVNCTDIDPVCLNESTALRCPFYGACAKATDFALPLELTRYY